MKHKDIFSSQQNKISDIVSIWHDKINSWRSNQTKTICAIDVHFHVEMFVIDRNAPATILRS